MPDQPDDPRVDQLLHHRAQLIDEPKRLLFDLDAIARRGEPDASAPRPATT